MNLAAAAQDKLKRILRRRAGTLAIHYKRTFMPEGAIDRSAEIVLADLRHECFAMRTTHHQSDAVMREREALRRMYLRIARLLGQSEDDIKKLVEIDYGPEFSIDD